MRVLEARQAAAKREEAEARVQLALIGGVSFGEDPGPSAVPAAGSSLPITSIARQLTAMN